MEVPRRVGETHRVKRLLPGQCGKTQMISKHAIVAYDEYKYSRRVCLRYVKLKCSQYPAIHTN